MAYRRVSSVCPASYRARFLHTSAIVPRELYAQYRRSLPSAHDAQTANADLVKQTTAFETASTTPAGSSFQDVPAPVVSSRSSKTALPLPAMKPIDDVKLKRTESIVPSKEIVVQGVVIPPKPRPPTEEECCMSGCVHCVYNIYADDLETYTAALSDARKALTKAGMKEAEWPEEVRAVKAQGQEGMVEGEKAKVREEMDPTMAAFLALEGKLKKKQGVGEGGQ